MQNTGDRTQNGTPSQARGPATSMDALSPFFKKKAHILEVLRKLEESDPLKFHPSSCLSSYHDVGQPLFPGDFPGPSISRAPHCRHSSSDSDIHEYASGDGVLQDDRGRGHGGCPSCRLLTQKSSLDSLLKGAPGHGGSFAAAAVTSISLSVREEGIGGQVWVDSHQQGATAGTADLHTGIPSLESTSHPYTHSTRTESRVTGGSESEASDQSQEPLDEGRSLQHHKDKAAEKLSLRKSLSRSSDSALQSEDGKHAEAPLLTQSQDQSHMSGRGEQECCYLVVDTDGAVGDEACEDSEKVCNGVYFSSNETSVSKKVAVDSYSPAPVPEKNSLATPQQQQQSSGKSKFALSPTSPPSCLSEVKPSPISSPSRLLKFLKIPAIGERPQTAQALRLSPQLTRSSKIPCRNNNYEVYHSPVMSRKATTTEREKVSSSTSSPKTDTYPGTHSAPTSPPKPDDNLCSSVPVKEVSYSSHSAPKPSRVSKGAPHPSSQSQRNSQKVPHYENVSELAASNGLPQFIPYSERDSGTMEKQQRNACDDKLLSPPSKTSDSSGGTGDSPSDSSDEEETDTESPVWHKPHQHYSLPASSSSASSKAQRVSTYSSMKDRSQERIATEAAQSQAAEAAQSVQTTTGSRKGEQPPSLPKRTVSAKPQNETSHHPFKERLAALGKLKSNEDLHQPMDKKEAQCVVGRAPASSTPGNNERSKTAERQGDRNVPEHRHPKYTDSLDGKPYPKTSLGGYTKYPSTCHEASPKSAVATGSANKGELETFTPRVYVAKSEGPKIKMGMSSSTEPPVVMRSYGKCQVPPNHHSKTSPSPHSSPTKVPSKSPSKTGQASSYPRGMKPAYDDRGQAQKHPARPDDKSKLTASKKKFVHAESFPPPPPPRPSVETSASTQSLEEKKPLAAASGLQSAIEQKVMRGIEENVLKLQEQDRSQAVETKQKTSNGIASWFGLKKSKLPALSRKPEMSKLRLNMSSSSSSVSSAANKDSKAGPRKVVESLNISKLMEKAEDLRKALEEERAYVNGVGVGMPLDRTGRGHSCEVVMDPTQGQLSLMYRGVTADNFMQQLLNR